MDRICFSRFYSSRPVGGDNSPLIRLPSAIKLKEENYSKEVGKTIIGNDDKGACII